MMLSDIFRIALKLQTAWQLPQRLQVSCPHPGTIL